MNHFIYTYLLTKSLKCSHLEKKQSLAFEFSTSSLIWPFGAPRVVTWHDRAFDYTADDDLGVYQVKVLYGTAFQNCGTILSDVSDFYDFVSRVAEIEAVVVKYTLILYFR